MDEPQRLWVPGKVPGFNDLTAAAKGFGGRGYGYANLKREWTALVANLAKRARLQPVAGPARLSFCWVEENRKRDPDGFSSGGRKVVLDGLVKAGVLADDGWDEIHGFTDAWCVGEQPGVHVAIYPVQEGAR